MTEKNIRDSFLERERESLSVYAFPTSATRGRDKPCAPCEVRTEFQRDRDRIIHCQSFRRLMYKTQVFLAPAGDHYRTRMTHTLEVTQIARIIARALRLNEDLTEAAALGHDIGHTPFGHAGEYAMQKCYDPGFTHYKQSLRVVELLENDGEGLNLTWEVRDGIVNHTGSHMASTLEGVIVKFADRIAYVNHDIDDACRAGILSEQDIPRSLREILGSGHSERATSALPVSGPHIFPQRTKFPVHWHDYFEFEFVVEGTGENCHNNIKQIVEAGSCHASVRNSISCMRMKTSCCSTSVRGCWSMRTRRRPKTR